MPNIREISAPPGLGLNPTEIGVDATAAAARRIGGFYNQGAEAINEAASLKQDLGRRIGSTITDVGDAVDKYETHREISAGAATGTALMAQKMVDWENVKKTADPNDPSVAQKFLTENLEPALEQWKSGFNTEGSQKYAEQFTDQLRRDMFHKTAAEMSTMAGIAVQQNAVTTVNATASAVTTDPASLDTSLKMLDHSLGSMVDSSPNLDAATGAKIKSSVLQEAKESTVKAAVAAMISKNPDIDLTAIEQKYGQYLKPGEMQQFQKAAQTQAKVNAYYDKQTQLAQKQQADLKVHSSATKTIADNISVGPNGKIIVNPNFLPDALKIVQQNPDAPSAASTFRTLADWGESQQNKEEKVASDPAIKQQLTDRMFDPDHPTTALDLMKASAAGQLSDHDFQTMHRLVTELETSPLKGPVWQATAAAVKDSLIVNVPNIPGKDNVGIQNYSTFMQSFVPQYLAKSRAGTLPPNALDTKDPSSMISQAMGPFRRYPADRMADYVAGAGGIGGMGAKPVDNQSTRMVGDVPVPRALNGVAALQYNKSKQLWRDQTTGTIYDAKGAEVKP